MIESKPFSANPDLRIVNPWPELLEFTETFDVHSEDRSHRGHIPYVILLIKWLEKWKKEVCLFFQIKIELLEINHNKK